MLESIKRLVLNFVDWVAEGVRAAVCWVIRWLLDAMMAVLTPLIQSIPDGWDAYLSQVQAWFQIVNAWVPIDVGIVLVAAYYTFMVTWIIVRYVMAAIPTVG